MVCLRNCPADAIRGEKKEVHVIDIDACTRCGTCASLCKFEAILVQ
jgi:Fe-S-cluster-containing hydrogenase component 2